MLEMDQNFRQQQKLSHSDKNKYKFFKVTDLQPRQENGRN